MKKYIRTKDGIYEFCKMNTYGNIELIEVYRGRNSPLLKVIHEKDIIKQADTIEELCDEYVWREMTFDKGKDYKGNDCLIDQDLEKQDHEITQKTIKEGIYGAVWCKWGLKYVAKMNEKGNLELL